VNDSCGRVCPTAVVVGVVVARLVDQLPFIIQRINLWQRGYPLSVPRRALTGGVVLWRRDWGPDRMLGSGCRG
jgi:hypothetical protein